MPRTKGRGSELTLARGGLPSVPRKPSRADARPHQPPWGALEEDKSRRDELVYATYRHPTSRPEMVMSQGADPSHKPEYDGNGGNPDGLYIVSSRRPTSGLRRASRRRVDIRCVPLCGQPKPTADLAVRFRS